MLTAKPPRVNAFPSVSQWHGFWRERQITTKGCTRTKRLIKRQSLDFAFDGKECRDC
ncbi:protein of unknown function [Shinella sp. WSC3-e]|nr:protein of unknown function [Shinella sp. WSC3-e]